MSIGEQGHAATAGDATDVHIGGTAGPDCRDGSTGPPSTWKRNIRAADADFTTMSDGACPDWFWTGPKPVQGAPGMLADGTVCSLQAPDLASASRQELLDYFDNGWLLTEVLFSGLQGAEAFYRPPYHQLRHPLIFYYGHPAALFVNKLRVAGLLSEAVNEHFEFIFETGVDEMTWDDLAKNDMLWPTVRKVTEYRRTVYGLVRNILATSPKLAQLSDTNRIDWHDPEWALIMAMEHERIHLETSSVLMRELPLQFVQRPQQWPPEHSRLHTAPAPANPMVPIPAGSVTLGKPQDAASYGWDNEYGCKDVHVGAFEVSQFQVSNGEMLDFVKAGGYRQQALWSDEGWRWRTFRNAKWPPFWRPNGPAGLHQYRLRSLWSEVDLPLAAPALVNAHEARAFAAWRTQLEARTTPSLRLITEAEHHRLRECAPGRSAPEFAPCGVDIREADGPAYQLAWGSEAPVDHGGRARAQLQDVAAAKAQPVLSPRSNTARGSDKGDSEACSSLENHVNGVRAAWRSAAAHPDDGALRARNSTDDNLAAALQHSSAPRSSAIAPGSIQSDAEAAAQQKAVLPHVMGNAWHWCEDLFSALPGNRGVHPLYDDFSTPCYDGQHALIMGGSFMSTGSEAGAHARFHFRPHFHQHAGFRLARSAQPPALTHIDSPPPHVGGWAPRSNGSGAQTLRDTEAYAAAALLGAYPAPSIRAAAAAMSLPPAAADFSRAAASAVRDALAAADRDSLQARVLEIGSGVGGVSFALARQCSSVTAVERDAAGIARAVAMQREGSATIQCAFADA